MKYLCMVYLDGAQMHSLSEAEREELDRQSLDYDETLKGQGSFVAAEALQPPAAAVTLRFRKGEYFVTDGPFVETHEHLGGFSLVGTERQAFQRQQLPGGRTNRVALTHLQRIHSDFRDWRICLSTRTAFDPGSNCAAGPGMRMRPIIAHVRRVTIRVCGTSRFQPANPCRP
jgi:hypothetical protein